MNESLVILGRQPKLGLAELESLYGAAGIRPVGTDAALVTNAVDFSRLGGAIKLGRVLGTIESTDWRELERFLAKQLPSVVSTMPEGKVRLGISAHGLPVAPPQILALGLTLKKTVRKLGRSVRLIPNKEAALNSAQTLHNQLTGPTGCEIIIVRDEGKLIIAQATATQDINSYTLRDRGRPKRDARVGMLPPKLAQIIINLAGHHTLSSTGLPPTVEQKQTSRPVHKGPACLLDPFCGTGVILQEALLDGYAVLGTDIEQRMVNYSRTNLEWFQQKFTVSDDFNLETGDATSHHWPGPVDLIACETYLGRPFTTAPSAEILAKTLGECNTIIKKFLKNVHPQLRPDTRLCLAVPAWQIKPNQFKHLPLIDQISEMGYNRVSFEHVRDDELLYYREDQIVARELLVITRK